MEDVTCQMLIWTRIATEGRDLFAYPMIEEFGLEDLIQFFESLGMLVTEQNGYYYPASLQAATVVDTLTQKLKHLHVDILTEFEVTKAEKRKSTFYVYGNDKCFQSSNLILATGGCAQPNLEATEVDTSLPKTFIIRSRIHSRLW